jgi:hypothetical protein
MLVDFGEIGYEKSTDDLMEVFDRFIKENDVTRARIIEMYASKSHPTEQRSFEERDIPYLIKNYKYELFVGMDSWSSSDEGIEFWTRISDEWEVVFSDIIENDPEMLDIEDILTPKQYFYKTDGKIRVRGEYETDHFDSLFEIRS